MSLKRLFLVALPLALLGLIYATTVRGTQSSGARGTQPSTHSRVVAIGDIHADAGAMRRALRLSGAINEKDEWIGGTMTIVQLGDLIGRSDDEREVLDFMFELQKRAAQRGGAVHALIGNHEIMGARVDNQAVGRNPFPAYEKLTGLNRNDPRLRILPPNERARGAALMAGGLYARRLAAFPTVLKLGDSVFVHGGVLPRWAKYGVEQINREVSQWLSVGGLEPDATLGVDDGEQVMWTRQFSSNVDDRDCALLDESLRILSARRMIVAHTVHPEITARCNGRLWAVDVGMSRYYGGPIQVLEILDDKELKVLR